MGCDNSYRETNFDIKEKITMDFVELNKRIMRAFKSKLNSKGQGDTIAEICEPGIAYSLMVMERVAKYYEVTDDDENRRAKNIYFRTRRILTDKLNGSKKINIIRDKRVNGIKYALSVMRAQREYLFIRIEK